MAEQTERTEIPNDYDSEFDSRLANIPWDNVPSDTTLPEKLFDWEIIDAYAGKTFGDATRVSKFKIVVAMEIKSPADYAGRTHTENYIIGTDNDPNADRTETWIGGNNFAAANLKRLMDFCGVNNPHALVGKQLACFTRNSAPSNDGRVYTNLLSQKFYKIGELTAGSDTPAAPGRGRARRTPVANNGTPRPDAKVECPVCHGQISQDAIGTHVQNCTGTPPVEP